MGDSGKSNSLDTIVKNEDGSFTVAREAGLFPAVPVAGKPDFYAVPFSKEEKKPKKDSELIAEMAERAGYKAKEQVVYTITVRPKSAHCPEPAHPKA